MNQLRCASLMPAPASPRREFRELSEAAKRAIYKLTGIGNPTRSEFAAWMRRLPPGRTIRRELGELLGVGPTTAEEVVGYVEAQGIKETDKGPAPGRSDALFNELGKRPYNVLQELTGKLSPLKEDLRDWINSRPKGTDIRRELLKHGKADAVEKLVAFAAREGFMKPEAAQKI